MRRIQVTLATIAMALATTLNAAESKCFGNVSNGHIESAVQLPTKGKNFSAYTTLSEVLGRNYVHSKVAEIVLAAYRGMEQSVPSKVFVYGETGLSNGGRIRPHRTHRMEHLSILWFL